jgi:diguanylate cyclase (GGDEF)-like protein
VVVVAELSVVLPPGPASRTDLFWSAALLALVAAAFFLPWGRLPSWLTVIVPVVEVASLLALVPAVGGWTFGVNVVLLVPLVWTALYHRRWESFVVVGAIVVAQVVTTTVPENVSGTVLLRRVVFWAAVGLLISVATHDLRDRLERVIGQRETTVRMSTALEAAAEQLTTISDPDALLSTVVRLAAGLAPTGGAAQCRVQYLRLTGASVVVVVQYDTTGHLAAPAFTLADRPRLEEVFRHGAALWRSSGASGVRSVGLMDPARPRSTGATSNFYVPVQVGEVTDGVLSLSLSEPDDATELFEYLKALGHLTELALERVRVHAALRDQATTDPLTGLANRRAFDRILDNRPGRLRFAVLSIDLDGLKQVNDRSGHEAGDRLLVRTAGALASVLRQGDVLARLGGDEFGAFLFDADEAEAQEVATRMLAALAGGPPGGAVPGVSIGAAAGGGTSDARAVFASADSAMYRAKRQGGRQLAMAGPVEPLAPT